MTQFRNRHWNQRFEHMGDEAESVFEAVWPTNFVAYGLRRPPLQVHKLAPFVRYTPDYLTSTKLVEVQGVGRDGQIKLKLEKYSALKEWHVTSMDVILFVWDSKNRQYGTLDMDDLERLWCRAYDDNDNYRGVFPEGKPYFIIEVADVTDWKPYEPQA